MDVATFPTDLLGAIISLEPITTGMSGAVVHAVTTARGAFIVRVHGHDTSSWDKVVPMQRLAAAHGVAPRLAYADDATRTTVSARITGPPLGAALQDPDVRPKVFASLVQQLARLHAVDVSDVMGAADASGWVADDPVPLARGLMASQSRRAGFPAWALPIGERIDGWDAALRGDTRRVLSHGDLNPANILWDGERVWLVDWERAGLAHPYMDLASLSNLLSLPEAAANGLLQMQEGGPLGVEQLALFGQLRDFTRVVYGLLFLSLAAELDGTGISQRESVPLLSDCWRMVFTGELSMKTARGQALIGAALLSQIGVL